MLKLNSLDLGIREIRFPMHQIECYFDVNEDTQDSIEEYIEEHHLRLMAWSSSTLKILKRSKTEEAKELLEEFKDLYTEFMESAEEIKKRPKKYSVIKTHSQTMYRVAETLDELDFLIEKETMNENLGMNL